MPIFKYDLSLMKAVNPLGIVVNKVLIFISILFIVFFQKQSFAGEECHLFLKNEMNQSSQVLWETLFREHRFLRQGQMPNSLLQHNGCGLVCSWNLVESIRLMIGQAPLSYEQIANRKQAIINEYSSAAKIGLTLGDLVDVMKFLMSSDLKKSTTVSAIHDKAHPADERVVPKSEFTENELFSVSSKVFKIILVELNRTNGPQQNTFVYAHYYNVISFKDGVVTLSDPNDPHHTLDFKVKPYTDWQTHLRTFELIPMFKPATGFGTHSVNGNHLLEFNTRYSVNGALVVTTKP